MSDSVQVHEISNIHWLWVLDLYRNKERVLGEGVEWVVEVKVVQEIKLKPGVSRIVGVIVGKCVVWATRGCGGR